MHDPQEVMIYRHLPVVVLTECRLNDPEYMEAVKRLLPKSQFVKRPEL